MPENVNTSTLSLGNESEQEDTRPTMVSVDHVSMSFNMASEQLNSLKEYAIKLVQRDLFFKEFKALDDVSFEVKKGDVFGIVGTNGSGKSTVLKIIAGVLDPSKGTCTVNGNIAPLIELGAGFDLELSARENIYLNGALLGYSKEFIDQNFDAIVAFAEVEKFLDMPMKNYSSGMVARIAFAIATIIVPDILIVDEVLSVGDFMFQKKCEARINELIEQHGVTVLIVSHSNEQISRMCNKAVWIEKGHARLQGDAAEVCRIYGALGGRTGDEESEKIVLDALAQSSDLENPPQDCMMIEGETANAICVKMVKEAWGESPLEAIALACSNTHSNSVTAAAFAAHFQIPILPIDQFIIPESLESYLLTTQPKTIYLFDSELQMGRSLDQLKQLPWKPSIVTFSNPKSHFDFSYDAFLYGQKRGFWSDHLAVISFTDNPDAMAMAPYLYAHGIPVIFLMDQGDHAAQRDAVLRACEMLSQGKMSSDPLIEPSKEVQLITIGKHAADLVEQYDIESQGQERIRITAVAASEESRRFAEMAEFYVRDNQPDEAGEGKENCQSYRVCIASTTNWPELQSCGCCVPKMKGAFLLVDAASLESVKEAFLFLRSEAEQIDGLVFLGNGFTLNGLDPRAFALQVR